MGPLSTHDDRSTAVSLGIELSLPADWHQVPAPTGEVVLAGPLVADQRPVVRITREPFSPPTPEGLRRGLTRVRAAQAEEYDGFELLADRALEIDGRSAYVMHFRWRHPAVALTQLFGLIVVEPGVAIQVDGVCRTELEAEQLPVLDAIVCSVTTPRLAASA